MNQTVRSLRFLGLASLSAASIAAPPGCAHTVENVVEAATPAAIESGLATIREPDNRQIISEIMQSQEMRDVIRDLGFQVTSGVIAALNAPDGISALKAGSVDYVHAVTRAAGLALERHMAPALDELTRRAVSGALDEALSEERRDELALLASEATAAVVEAAVSSLAVGVRDELAPALEAAFRINLQPAIADLLYGEVQQSIAVISRLVAREAVLGSNEALATLQGPEVPGEEPRSILTGLLSLTESGVTVLVIVAIAAVLGLIGALLWIARLVARTRRFEAESKERSATADRLAAAAAG